MLGICRECIGSAMDAQMYGISFAGPSCLPHVLYSCAVEASKAEWALSKKSIFPGTTGSAGLHGAGTGR